MNGYDRIAAPAVMYSSGGSRKPVIDPDYPLWPGTYAHTILSDGKIQWQALSVDEWEGLSSQERLEVFLVQLRQVVSMRDARGEILSHPWPTQMEAAFGLRDLRRNLHAAICHAYQIMKSNEDDISLAMLSAESIVELFRSIYGVELPIVGTGEAIIAMVGSYGSRYCGLDT
jgi:hypothetical protein